MGICYHRKGKKRNNSGEKITILSKGKKIKSSREYKNSLKYLLSTINQSYSLDKVKFEVAYRYCAREMDELFQEIKKGGESRDKDLKSKAKAYFKFLCRYLHSRKDFLEKMSWIELDKIREILSEENLTEIYVIKEDKKLTDCYNELLKEFHIKNKINEIIIVYKDNDLIKYLLDILFKDGFFKSYVNNVLKREDENNLNVDNLPEILLDIFLLPIKAFNLCEKNYLLKNKYYEDYSLNFKKKIDKIINSDNPKDSNSKSEFKKRFIGEIIDNFNFMVSNFCGKFIEDKKNKQICKDFVGYCCSFVNNDFCLKYGLDQIIKFIGILQNMEKEEGINKNIVLYSKEYSTNFYKKNKIDIKNIFDVVNYKEECVINVLSFFLKMKFMEKKK